MPSHVRRLDSRESLTNSPYRPWLSTGGTAIERGNRGTGHSRMGVVAAQPATTVPLGRVSLLGSRSKTKSLSRKPIPATLSMFERAFSKQQWWEPVGAGCQATIQSSDGHVPSRTVELNDGRVFQLPDDVRIADITCKMLICIVNHPMGFCPEQPQIKLIRGEAEIWIDAHGRMILWSDENDRASFAFLEQYMPKSGE